jgi:hypothetical protein
MTSRPPLSDKNTFLIALVGAVVSGALVGMVAAVALAVLTWSP